MKTFFMITLAISAVIIIGLIMAQPSKNQGLSGLMTGGSNENYFAKNKIRTREKNLAVATVIFAVVFIISVIGLNFVS